MSSTLTKCNIVITLLSELHVNAIVAGLVVAGYQVERWANSTKQPADRLAYVTQASTTMCFSVWTKTGDEDRVMNDLEAVLDGLRANRFSVVMTHVPNMTRVVFGRVFDEDESDVPKGPYRSRPGHLSLVKPEKENET